MADVLFWTINRKFYGSWVSILAHPISKESDKVLSGYGRRFVLSECFGRYSDEASANLALKYMRQRCEEIFAPVKSAEDLARQKRKVAKDAFNAFCAEYTKGA